MEKTKIVSDMTDEIVTEQDLIDGISKITERYEQPTLKKMKKMMRYEQSSYVDVPVERHYKCKSWIEQQTLNFDTIPIEMLNVTAISNLAFLAIHAHDSLATKCEKYLKQNGF